MPVNSTNAVLTYTVMSRIILAFLCALGVTVAATGCTPRPDVADDAAAEFLERLAERNEPETITDKSDTAAKEIDNTWAKLQAEGLDAQLKDVRTQDNVATASYRMDWQLPGERRFAYDSQMTLTKSKGDWVVRWQPTVLHPRLGANQHMELRTVAAETASVVGSDGAVLMKPGKKWRIFLNADKAGDARAAAERIAAEVRALGGEHAPTIDAEKVAAEAKKVDGDYSVVMVEDKLGQRLRGALRDVPGVRLNDESALVRPDPNFAPDILSRVNAVVEDELKGTDGWKVIVSTAEGNEVTELEKHEAKEAPSVQVSLSKKVQDAAQRAVDTRADSQTMMVVMRPSTGEVLAVAQTAKADEHGDLALQGQYPPGSTFKIITAYAGLEKQNLTPDSIVGCPGTQDIGGRIVTNYNGSGFGDGPLRQAFARSCNTTFADISTKLKPGELKATSAQFGLGVDFKIPGLDTFTGSVPTGEVMLDRTEAGYGQGHDLVSPFGMALVSATAAAGKMPTPYLITSHKPKPGTQPKGAEQKPTGNKSSTDKDKKAPAGPQPLDKKRIAELQAMMQDVVTNGTAAGLDRYGDVRGKTGEAEINDGSHAWFTGYRGDLAFATLIVRGGGSEHATAVTGEFFKHLDAPAAPRENQLTPAAEG
ncbi:penicillin-binding transpeptidase domain-containing protein [Corynebacterium urealyticum]|uniref:penicillin-binding transpeptidase domain-containing protein n=1 Tax=Corynebacterium urealyticum TaxID=43771 RepID=UPI0011EA8FA1|nr:penicillin-binding transpeptidase domain-containing protein [Corynebacterium urealyticum]TYT20659.1 penicillin-binding transpeptidase domain-containing protein [Corynebacterium urealyticum]